MLRSASELKGYTLLATDGELGRCKDFLFDDVFWTIRYMVADTGKWLPGRKVLISPVSLDTPDWSSHRFPVRLSKEEIKGAPDVEEHAPVSRQYERRYFRHFGWPYYWGGTYAWGMFPYPEPLYIEEPPEEMRPENEIDESEGEDQHLRSVMEVCRYTLGNKDDENLGRVDDFIIEDGTWTVRYLVVNLGGWLKHRKVLISPAWIENVSWREGKVTVAMTRDVLKSSPPYDPSMPVNRKYEEQLFDFHGRPRYWGEDTTPYSTAR